MKSNEKFRDLNSLQISLLSPEDIIDNSHGEVTNSKSINYKTMNPERSGLFCEVIFGPMKEYECRCGSISGIEYTGVKCPTCSVEVNTARVRRYRLGHISLTTPIPHVWFLKIKPYYLLTLIGIRMKDMESLLLSKNELVSIIRPKSVLNRSDDSHRYKILQGKKTFSGSGCEILYNYLCNLDLSYEYLYQRYLISGTQDVSIVKKEPSSYLSFINNQSFLNQLKRLRVLEYLLSSGKRPEWMFLKELPVLPPELRPFLIMDSNLVVSSDLNFFYKRIIERNNRLKDLLKLKNSNYQYALSSFYYNELCMLQHAVDSLIENGRRGKAMVSRRQLPLKSITSILKGKEGRFRMNLLGKRVDLSARAVISVGPRLKLTQCGIPISIALILFKSLIYTKIPNFSSYSKRVLQGLYTQLDLKNTEVFQYLNSSKILCDIEKVVSYNPVLLNRAPTLHKLNIQAFQPIIINSKSVQLHPLVCSSFNADFDGDQMAIHLPISLSSQVESRMLMMTYNNILNCANGTAIISPSQDIVFGLYYLTQQSPSLRVRKVNCFNELRCLLRMRVLSIHSRIQFPVINREFIDTTAGRVLLYQIFPENTPFLMANNFQTKSSIQKIIKYVYNKASYEDFLFFIDSLMALGFYYAHSSGISLSLTDCYVPSLKTSILDKAVSYQKKYLYASSSLAAIKIDKARQSMIVEWFRAQEILTSLMLKDVHHISSFDDSPSIHKLVHSGARGSILQMRQISGIRGLMVKPSGELIDMPIQSNFKEGLTSIEYFYSTHGARKGVIDTSIRTATSGYLTRRLVHAVQDFIITEEDCGTQRRLTLRPYKEKILANDELSSHEGRNGSYIDAEGKFVNISSNKDSPLNKVSRYNLRTPLTCESKQGICKACYGTNLNNNYLSDIGEAIGIISAQSIGEPGTQLTMRTFHMGGVSLGGHSASVIRSTSQGRVLLKNPIIISKMSHMHSSSASNCSNAHLYILDDNDHIQKDYKIPFGSLLYVQDGQYVDNNQILFKWNPYYEPIFYKGIQSSTVYLKTLHKNDTRIACLDLISKELKILNTNYFELSRDVVYAVPQHLFYTSKDVLNVKNYQEVKYGDILYLMPRTEESRGDITGGLSRISQLFESSYGPHSHVLSLEDSLYVIRPTIKFDELKWNVTLLSGQTDSIIFKDLHSLRIRSSSFLKKGEQVSFSSLNVLDVLSLYGVQDAIKFLKKQILNIYKSNGVSIHDKHIELILKRMFGRIEVLDKGSTSYIASELVDMRSFIHNNVISLSKAISLATGRVSTRGVTSVSLENQSFLSSASFQNTSQVLTTSAVTSKKDYLLGLGENAILGRLTPVGSGSFLR